MRSQHGLLNGWLNGRHNQSSPHLSLKGIEFAGRCLGGPGGYQARAWLRLALANAPRLSSAALPSIMHPIGAKSQRHAPLLQRCGHPAQKTVIVFVLIRLKIEITRDPAQGFISDPFDKYPHKAVISSAVSVPHNGERELRHQQRGSGNA